MPSQPRILVVVENVYFALTEAFNREAPTVVLASGQAVVYYRLAIMSKDGDWVVRESPEACQRVLHVLSQRGARYRVSAPLDVRWLRGGWSSHLEFVDEKARRVRCDVFSRPPRVETSIVNALFDTPQPAALRAIDVPSLIAMKRTQRGLPSRTGCRVAIASRPTRGSWGCPPAYCPRRYEE